MSHLSIARQALVAFLDSPCVEHLSSKCPGVVPVPPADRCVGRCDRRAHPSKIGIDLAKVTGFW